MVFYSYPGRKIVEVRNKLITLNETKPSLEWDNTMQKKAYLALTFQLAMHRITCSLQIHMLFPIRF